MPRKVFLEDYIQAAADGSMEIIKQYLGQGGNVDDHLEHGSTALNMAAQKGHLDIVKFLIGKGANIDFQNRGHGATPLLSAAMAGKMDVVKYLVDEGADIDLGKYKGSTAAEMALHNNHPDVAQFLSQVREMCIQSEDAFIVKHTDGRYFCFTRSELINNNFVNPYTRTPFTKRDQRRAQIFAGLQPRTTQSSN